MVTYEKGDVMNVSDPLSILVHACNCEGRWGSGVAVCFRQRFPQAHHDYQILCRLHGHGLIGTTLICDDQKPAVGCLFTSRGYGQQKDSVDQILFATDRAIKHMFEQLAPNIHIHSPMINAGLFAVPWEKTEEIINRHLELRPDLKWTVWQL